MSNQRTDAARNLAGSDFSGKDVRGVDFSGALLHGANFSGAVCGQKRAWRVGLLLSATAVCALAGLMLGYAGGLIGHLAFITERPGTFGGPLMFWISSALTLVILAVLVVVMMKQGLGSGLAALAVSVALAVGLAVWAGSGQAIVSVIVQFFGLSIALAGSIIGAVGLATCMLAFDRRAAYALAPLFVLGAVPGVTEAVELSGQAQVYALVAAGAVVAAMTGLSIYLALAAVPEHGRFPAIRGFGMALSCCGGTSFRNADLAGANFTNAVLRSADLRGAVLSHCCWLGARDLAYARVAGTYLEDPAVRELVTSKNGRRRNYSRMDVRKLDLDQAQLEECDFSGADLSETRLRMANLERSKLADARVYGADLTGASMTGAFIEWC